MPELGIEELKHVKDQLEEILIIKKARKDFATFSEYVFGYKPGQIHLEWFDLANKAMANRRPCVIFAPRGHSKTTFMSVIRPIFLLGHNPNLRIKIVSHSNDKAADILRQIKEAIEFNENLHKVFPNLKPGSVWAANKIIVERSIWSKDVSIEASGVLSGATGGRCVGEGTLIITSKGVKPIEDVKEGNRVLTREGKFRRVIKTWKRPHTGKVIVIKSKYQNFNKIVVTPEHKIFVKEVDENGEIAVTWRTAEEIFNNKDKTYYLVFPRFKHIGTHVVSSKPEIQKEVEKYFSDINFWRLAGYYMAEGCLTNYKGGTVKKLTLGHGKHFGVRLFFGSHELDYISDVCSILDNWNQKYWTYTNKRNATSISFCNKLIWKIFTSFGHKAPNKKIPYWVLGASHVKQIEFIKGYLRGDGCIYDNNLSFSTTSLEIAIFLTFMFTKFGIFPKIHKLDNVGKISYLEDRVIIKKHPSYNVTIYNTSNYKVIDYLLEREKVKNTRIGSEQWGYDDLYVYIPIDKIYEEDYSGYVYDLSVENDHSFCSIWGVLHNSTYIVFDDIVEFKNTLQEPAKIPMVKEAFYNNWLNLLEADNYGWCLIGTIWTQYDLHWDLYKNDSFKYKRMYRIDLNTLEPIWPEYWSKEKLQQKLEEIGPRAFARAYGNMPISREDMVFNEDHINACKIRSEVKRFRKLCNLKILGVDLALSQKKKSANTALFLLGITPKEKFIPLHIEYGKWSSPETTRAIIKICDEFDVDLVVVESNQYQDSLRQWINEFRQDIKVESHYTSGKKLDPEIGLPAMALDFERKKWIIPAGKIEHPSDCKCGLCTWLNEVIMYPFAEHSDILMASYFAREGYRRFFKEKVTKGDYDVIDLF